MSLAPICSYCMRTGHTASSCPRRPRCDYVVQQAERHLLILQGWHAAMKGAPRDTTMPVEWLEGYVWYVRDHALPLSEGVH